MREPSPVAFDSDAPTLPNAAYPSEAFYRLDRLSLENLKLLGTRVLPHLR